MVRNKLDGILLSTVGASLPSALPFAGEPGNRVMVVVLGFFALVTSYREPSPE